ncbi:MAG: DUF262 and DUF1524 domain-containing protein [Anaerolineae bacterium]
MKAVEAFFLPFLQGAQQFVIPIYQRTYSWTPVQVQQLWRDILRVSTDPNVPSHFIGSIVYIADREVPKSQIQDLLVIDGQQRLTTLTLLLAALRRALARSDAEHDITVEALDDYFLHNRHGKGEMRYRLLLTENDRDTLKALVDDREPPPNASPRLVENFRFFSEQLSKPGVNLDQIYTGLAKLSIVDIRLERGSDNPQLIFESLNSTGLDLSQADLVRNYILMDLPPQEQTDLYTAHWRPMELRLTLADGSSLFDRFMRDYLTIEGGRIPNIGQVYTEFKQYVQTRRPERMRPIVADLHHHSHHFSRLVHADDPEPAIREAVQDINRLEVNVAYPFLMQVYDDYDRKVIGKADFAAILRLIESYVFRRAICGIPTNSLNKTFLTLYRSVEPDHYLDSVRAAFARMTSYQRFPNDEEFRNLFVQRDVYNLRPKTRGYLFRRLEQYDNKEVVDSQALTVEHVMPQHIEQSSDWQTMLGPNWQDVHAKYLHTIGNLTLTGYNPELSNRPFPEKRDMPGGFKYSKLALNRRLAELDRWDEAAIAARAGELADVALKVWPSAGPAPTAQPSPQPSTTPEALTPTQKLTRVFRDYDDLEAARALVRDLVHVVDDANARRLLVATFRDGRRIALTLGGWYVLSFIRRSNGLTAGFCFDYGEFPAVASLSPRSVEPFAARYSAGRDIRWAMLYWNHLNQPPNEFLRAWRSAVALAGKTFKDWQAAQVASSHEPDLLEALLSDAPIIGAAGTTVPSRDGYTLDSHLATVSRETRDLFYRLRERILGLDPVVWEDVRKMYIAYKAATNFVDITPQQKALVLTLNMPFAEVTTPRVPYRDVSAVGHWGNGDVELTLTSPGQIDDAMGLIRQSLLRQLNRP